MKKILIVFGTRPEAIKMAPLVKEFLKHPGTFDTKLCVTAQHREMLDQVLDFFELVPDFDLNLMKPNQNLYTLTADIITGMKPILDEVNPDYVFVHGDTTTSTAVALAGFYHGAKVCHIEAGLRTYNKHAPWPEELNRQMTGRIADFHFAPTERSKRNLLEEKVPEDSILVTGNTVIDALMYAVEKVRNDPPIIKELDGLFGADHVEDGENLKAVEAVKATDGLRDDLNIERPEPVTSAEGVTTSTSHDLNERSVSTGQNDPQIVLITGHRRENHGQGFENICAAIAELARRFPETQFIYPVHLNPNVQEPVNRLLRKPVVKSSTLSGLNDEAPSALNDLNELNDSSPPTLNDFNGSSSSTLNDLNQRSDSTTSTSYPNIHLIEPLDYPSFVWLMDKARLIITDSGGVQEEAPSLGKPVLVMRDTTERPEAVDAGTVILVGTDSDRIVREVESLLTIEDRYNSMSKLHNPYGDGNACGRVVEFLSHL